MYPCKTPCGDIDCLESCFHYRKEIDDTRTDSSRTGDQPSVGLADSKQSNKQDTKSIKKTQHNL